MSSRLAKGIGRVHLGFNYSDALGRLDQNIGPPFVVNCFQSDGQRCALETESVSKDFRFECNQVSQQRSQLPKPDLAKFSVFREANALTEDAPDDIAGAQQEEVLRRQAEYLANPSLATAWDDGFFDRLRQCLAVYQG